MKKLLIILISVFGINQQLNSHEPPTAPGGPASKAKPAPALPATPAEAKIKEFILARLETDNLLSGGARDQLNSFAGGFRSFDTALKEENERLQDRTSYKLLNILTHLNDSVNSLASIVYYLFKSIDPKVLKSPNIEQLEKEIEAEKAK